MQVTRNLHDSYNTCEDPAYFRWGFLWICRTLCPASCPVIRIFLLEQKQTWRATGLLVPIRVRTHETTPGLAALWLGTKKQRFCGTNQKPERLRPFGTGPVRLCPQGLLVSYFTFLRRNFFSPVTTFPSPPLIAPGSPRMVSCILKSTLLRILACMQFKRPFEEDRKPQE